MKILQLFTSSLGRNPRPTRFNALLSKFGKVTVCSAPPEAHFTGDIEFVKYNTCNGKPNTSLILKGVHFIKLWLGHFEEEVWPEGLKENLKELEKREFSLIICQNIKLLPLAVAVKNSPQNKKKCKLIFDAREFYPREVEESLYWRLRWRGIMDYLCREYLPKADVVFTVSKGLAKGYRDDYGVDCQLLPSFSYYHDLQPKANNKPLRFIHHGMATPGRKLELMVEAFKSLNGVANLDLMLVASDNDYMQKLNSLVSEIPNVNIIPTVLMQEIIPFISQYDMGVFLLTPNNFNHKHFLPNKLFEFIQARLGVIVSPVPDMSALVKERQVGLVTDNYTPESLTKTILSLTPEMVYSFKQNSHEAAKELCWEENEKLLSGIISKLLQ